MRTAQEEVHVQGNHSSSFPPSQRMCAECFPSIGGGNVASLHGFPVVHLESGGAAVFRRLRDPLAQFPEASSLVLGRIPLYCVVAGSEETW